jgi:putative pyruvate formate lyase activating enzyme
MYQACKLCPRECGVNRYQERGFCGAQDTLRLARAALHMWEEPCISGTRGSGTVFFSGCSLGCIYCQNRDIALGKWGKDVDRQRLLEIFYELEEQGAHNINLVTATHYIPTVADAIREAKKQGFSLPFVWNTSGYEKVESLRILEGLVDIYLTDLRYSSTPLAKKYSHAPDYPQVAKEAIEEMVRQTGVCQFDDEGMMVRGTLVRILLLPDGVGDAKLSLLHLWKKYGDHIGYSIMQQYTPMPHLPAPLDRRVTPHEYRTLVEYAISLGIEDAYIQEREAAEESFIPPFDLTGV